MEKQEIKTATNIQAFVLPEGLEMTDPVISESSKEK